MPLDDLDGDSGGSWPYELSVQLIGSLLSVMLCGLGARALLGDAHLGCYSLLAVVHPSSRIPLVYETMVGKKVARVNITTGIP